MSSPNTLTDYFLQHPPFEEQMRALDKFFVQIGLQGEIVQGEPHYFKDEVSILGCRAYDNQLVVWFKNDLEDDEFLQVSQKVEGFHPIHFKKGETLDMAVIKSNVEAAMQRRLDFDHLPAELKAIFNKIKDNRCLKDKQPIKKYDQIEAKQDNDLGCG